MGKPLYVRLTCLALLIAALPFVAWNDFVQHINGQFYDLLLSARRAAAGHAPVVLLAIDDQTVARYGPLPLSRQVLARGLDVLAEFAPSVLGVDLLLAEPGRAEDDRALAATLARFPKTVLAAALSSDSPDAGWIWPLEVLRARAALGHVHAAPDEDGIVRSVLLEKRGRGRRLWAFGLECARLNLAAPPPVEAHGSVRLAGREIPARLAESRRLLIDYAGPEGVFHRVSFSTLLDGNADPTAFHGQLVILGITAQGAGDRLFTPVSAGGLGMSGIEIHANIVRTLLNGSFLTPLNVLAEIFLYLAIAAGSVVLARRLRGLRLASALIAAAVVLPAASYASLRWNSVWPLASLLAVFIWSAGIAVTAEYGLAAAALRRAERQRQEYAYRVQAMAHEIKTPLTAIQGSSEMIADRSVPEPARAEIAGLIYKESKRLTALIEAFLNVERIATGSLALEKRHVDLELLCAEVVERARLYAARKRTEIRASLRPVTVLADPELLSFAVYNLLTNAIKYSPKQSSIQVEVSAGSGTVSITVADPGVGIDPGEQQKIFERFYRIERAGEPGTGLGLALVKEIAVQHGGRIELDSQPGSGSRFTLVLPAEV